MEKQNAKEIILAPSLLAANFAVLGEQLAAIRHGGATYLHLDVMDGLFVPNISIGLPVVKSLRKATDMFLDVHLMIDRPHRYVAEFCRAGADMVVFHVEADQPQDLFTAIETVRDEGKLVGLAVKPRSPASTLVPYLRLVDLVLEMTVEPGFGGQSFMHDQLTKLETLRQALDEVNPNCELEVDGGIDPTTAPLVTKAGANVLVAGSAVFGKADRRAAIEAIRGAGA